MDFLKTNNMLIKCFSTSENIVIPDNIITISRAAFANNHSIKSVVIPKSVKAIEDYAFEGCENLESVTILNDKIKISKGAFKDCRALADQNGYIVVNGILFGCTLKHKEIVIPENVTEIGESAFIDCRVVEKLVIPPNVKTIGVQAFKNCIHLEKIEFSEGLLKIENYAFASCMSLDNVQIPTSVERVFIAAFSDCTNLSRVSFYGNPSVIDGWSFKNCPKLADKNGMIIISGILCYCHNVTEDLIIPEGVTAIVANALDNTSNVRTLTLPASIRMITSDNFQHCSNIRKIRLPFGVPYLEYEKTSLFLRDKIYIYGDKTHNEKFDQSCRQSISKDVDRHFKKTVKDNSVYIIERILGCCEKVAIQRLDRMIDFSVSNNANEITAFLIDYKNRMYTSEQITEEMFERTQKELGLIPKTKQDWQLDFDFLETDNSISILSYVGYDKHIIIPEYILDKKVVGLNEAIFYDAEKGSVIEVPKTVQRITGYNMEDTFASVFALFNVTIYGKEGSFIESYAKKNMMKFIPC